MRGFSPGGQLPQPRGRGLFPALFNRRPKVELDDQIYLVEGAEHGEAGVKLMLIKDNGEVVHFPLSKQTRADWLKKLSQAVSRDEGTNGA